MNLTIRKSAARGQADHGWLKSQHTFSFAEYYDPQHMGYRSLRVINEDWVAPGRGFPTHPHRDMEIFTVMVAGTLEHKDSMGNGRQIRPGQIQMMSAGRGVTHSEFNPSADESAHLLQIWITPNKQGLTPSYTEWQPDPARLSLPKALIISADGRDGSATIHQDADIYRLSLKEGESITHEIRAGRGVWLQLISGGIASGDMDLSAGDALHCDDSGPLILKGNSDAAALLFDLK